MPQITRHHHLRLLIHHHHPSSHLLFSPFLPKFTTFKFRPTALSLFTKFSSITNNNNPKVKTKNTRRTHTNTSLDTHTNMDPTPTSGFNKRRAEGRDKSDKTKNLQLKVRKINPVNTISYLQILGTGMDTQDTSPSVLLFFDKQRFIFNAGEGLQRYCTEHKIKLSKVDHIFLSRVCSETAGGLPGLLLTMAGIGDDGMCVNMWGPSDLKYMISAMRTFIPKAAMVHARSFGPSPDSDQIPVLDSTKFSEPIDLVKDEVVRISAIILQPNNNNEAKLLGSSESDLEEGKDDCPVSNANDVTQAVIKPGDLSVIYTCELPEIQGKFDPEKAKALGLKPGPKYRDLQLGKSVKSDRFDIMVNPCDVMDPPIPGPIVLLVDCPTTSHLQNLLSIGSLNVYYTDSSSNQSSICKEVNCIVHLTPSTVANNPDYRRWMERFGSAQHIMAGHERKNVQVPVLKSSARIAARLNYLCPQFFPAPGFWSLHNITDSLKFSNSSLEAPKGIIAAENLLKFHLRPYANLGLDKSSIPGFAGPAEVMDELLSEIPDIADVAQQLKQLSYHPKEVNGIDVSSSYNGCITEEPWFDEIGLPSCVENIGREDMEIVLLGTGSSQPSKYRNVSSIYINLFSKGGLLFDCGEGTLGQLKRRFGVEGADDAVRSLKCIWISHIHADHHAGLARILTLRRDLLKGVPHEPLLVVGPGQLMRFLNAYQRLEELDMQFLDCKHTDKVSWDEIEGPTNSITDQVSPASSGNNFDNALFGKGSRMQSYMKKPSSPSSKEVGLQRLNYLKRVLEDAGLATLVSFPVVHCPQAFGVALKAAQRISTAGEAMPGWKIVYSGDTRPCPELIEASRGATVLIHEATFEDGLVDEAIARNHSTTKEAIEVGEAAGVYRIILTHFSQRYPKIPVFDDSHMHNTCIGFDLMSINLADLPVLPHILKHLKLLFRNEMGIDEIDELEPVKEA